MSKRIALFLLVVVPAIVRAEPADKETIKFLQSLQNGDGGFLPAPQDPNLDQAPRSSLRATSAAIRALKYFGGELQNKDKVTKFVASCFDEKTGGFADMPMGVPDVAVASVGLMVAVELEMPLKMYEQPVTQFLVKKVASFEDARIAAAGFEAVKKIPPKEVVERWSEFADKFRKKDGSYGAGDGMSRDSASALVTRMRLGLNPTGGFFVYNPVLFEAQRADGAYGKAGTKVSDLESTYRVMRAIKMLNGKPADAAKLKDFVAKCRNKDGGYGVAPGQPSTVSGTYFAGIILYWLK